MDGYMALLDLFPEPLRGPLQRIPVVQQALIHEIRLYGGRAVAVSIAGKLRYVTVDGALTDRVSSAYCCDAVWIRQIVDRVCQQSVYAHGEELRHGFLPAPQGCRIGVAGTAVLDHGSIVGYRQITSLCLRVARDHRGCASELARRLCQHGVESALLCGEPSSGKTTLLRDLLREFSARGLAVAVVDERGELTDGGVPCGCDVLRGTPKATGIIQAIRSLAPRVVVFDELGDAAEIAAVQQALTCGVPVVASVHCRLLEELRFREALTSALSNGAFTYLVQLRGCEQPGNIASVIRTEEWYESGGNVVDLSGGDRMRTQRRSTVASTCSVSGTHCTMVGMDGGTYSIHSGTAE